MSVQTERATYRITGLDCPDCARTLDKSVGYVDGVVSATLSFANGLLVVDYEPKNDPRDEIVDLVRKMDYGIQAEEGSRAPREPQPEPRMHEVAVAGGGGLLLGGWLIGQLGAPQWASWLLLLAAIGIGGAQIYRRAVASLRARIVDMNVLMSIAVAGAVLIGEPFEAATVVFLFSIGGLLEARSLARTRRSIRELMSLTPPVAHLERGGAVDDVAVESLVPGDRVVVRPGERIPVDGTVVEGVSAANEAPITGESLPVDKAPGDHVWAGTLNVNGVIHLEVWSAAGETTLDRIIFLVEEAQAQQAPFQRTVDRFTRWYTPAVVAIAAVLAVVVPVVFGVATGTWEFREWFYRALVLLVVSCPCALVIATPVSIVSAITRGARDGVLIKGGAFLELAPLVRAIAFDKTGTLTHGRPEVASVVPLDGDDAARLLAIAAAIESHSTHPIAQAIVRAAGHASGAGLRVVDVNEHAGSGVTAVVDGVSMFVGKAIFAEEHGVRSTELAAQVARLEAQGQSVVIIGRLDPSPTLVGVIGVVDIVRDEMREFVGRVRARGIEHAVMLTGDNERVGHAVASQAGIDEVLAGLLPADKTRAIGELKERYGVVAMVGDGINDAPALAAADIGIAMGAAGSDAALEAADIALMADDLAALPGFFALARRTLRTIRVNVWFSIVVKLAVLVAAMIGYAHLWLAVFADTGVALLVILNGLTLLRSPRQV